VAGADRLAVEVQRRLPKTRKEKMVLTKEELIATLQNEVRILLHLASKVDRNQLDYRPTPKQRSTIELLRYLTIMGPNVIPAVKTGAFDGAAFGASQAAANAMNFDQVLAAIEKQSAFYAQALGSMPDADFRSEIDMFGKKASRGSHMVFLVLGGFAAYRTQLFLYLKACGRDELNTMNLWGVVDGPMQG
jgi:hypothetical protein